MSLPNVSWTSDGHSVGITDWQFNSVANGGYDRMSGTAREADWNRLPSSSQRQGAVVTAYTQAGRAIYEGVLPRNPQIKGGLVFIEAEGHKREVEKRTERLLFQSRDYQAWSDWIDAPFDQSGQEESLEAIIKASALVYKLLKDTAYSAGDFHGLAFWAPGSPDEFGNIRRYAFDLVKTGNAGNFDLRTRRFTGPQGTATTIEDINLGAAGPSSVDTGIPSANAEDALVIIARANANATPGINNFFRLKNLRVNGLRPANRISDDNYQSWVCVKAITDRVGYDQGGISTSPSRNVLPLDWTEDWASALDYLTLLDDSFWRVLDDRGNGPLIEYDKWANSKEWFVSSHGADVDLKPLELYDGAIVKYENHRGRRREKKVIATNPPGTGLFFEEELEDPQNNDTLATNVATDLAEYLSQPRYAGSVQVVSAKDSTGRDTPREVRAGDVLTISDFGPAESLTKQRILEVSQTRTEVMINIEAQDPTALVSRDVELFDLARLRRKKRRRRRRR